MKFAMSSIYVFLLLAMLYGQFKGEIETVDFDQVYESWKELTETQLQGDVITKKETALAIGKVLLEDYFSRTFKENTNERLEAYEKDGIWVVYNIYDPQKLEDGSILITKDGGVRVFFRKSDGKVLKFELDG